MNPDNLFQLTIIDDIVTPEERQHIISLAEGQMQRSRMWDGKPITGKGRTSTQCWIKNREDKIIYNLSHRIAYAVGLPVAHAEALQVLHYDVGQEYGAHFDAGTIDTPERAKAVKGWGQRHKTALMYLNDVEEGGETDFPNVGMTVKPKAGRAVIFNNIDQEAPGVPLFESLHHAKPVVSGEKWACNWWFRQAPASLREK